MEADFKEGEYSYALSKLTEDLKAEVVHAATDFEDVQIYTGEVHRPGLQLAGFFDYFMPSRIQVIGRMESAYMLKLSDEERLARWNALFSRKVTALIVCQGAVITQELVKAAHEHNVTVLSAKENATEVMASVISIMKVEVAPRITRHGVLVEVYGMGLFIVGDSGVGKSETAIELLKRGHRLIADDAVEIKAIDTDVVQGSAPALIKHYVELRGIGVIDVRQIFGVGAVRGFQKIHLVVNLEPWDDKALYDRLGINENTVNILGVEVAAITIPVTPGRNLAVILEVAAMNQRQKYMGYNAAQEFIKQIDNYFDEM